MKFNLNNKLLRAGLVVLFLILLGLAFFYEVVFTDEEFHVHADFKVYLNGTFINFSEKQFQSDQLTILHDFVHLHDGNGDVIHFHEDGIPLAEFFKSLGMEYTRECFTDHLGNEYCNQDDMVLVTAVNYDRISNGPEYIVEDLDRILIAHVHKDQDLAILLGEITDKACIESAICPERGAPSEGSCTTGGTCVVDLNSLPKE